MEIARAFAEHGVDGVDVSTGQVVSDERPAFGRSYQTPFADRIRNEIGRKYGVAVIAVGVISSYDDVNSILLAGRPTSAPSAGPTCMTRSGPCTPRPTRATRARARPGRTSSPRATASRRPAAPTARAPGWS